MIRVVFFGTPSFAVPTLEALCVAGRRPARVVAQPDRPAGRGRRLRPPPVALRARELELPVEQPARLSDPALLERLEADAPDVAVVVAYGKIFRRRLLELPALGCLNLHASLLPAYRGAAPIQAAIAAGETVTGVTTMWMERDLDSGPILLQRETAIGPRETAAELSERLARLGAGLVVGTLERLEKGELTPRPQDETRVSWAPLLTREDGRVDWTLPAAAIADRLRAYTPWPGLTARLWGEPVKLVVAAAAGPAPRPAEPGEVVAVEDGRLLVACGEGSALAVERLQRPGRRALPGDVFAHGERLAPGARLE